MNFLYKQLLKDLHTQGISQQTINSMAKVDRAKFVPQSLLAKCYENTALPIGEKQTISQPYIVAKMTDLLELQYTDKILEIGTGSGYQTAILSKLVKEVYSIERIRKLQIQALRKLNQLELYNVKLKHGDGWQGWLQNAPYDAIIVTAAADEMPIELLKQLQNGGRLLIPIAENGTQKLKRITKVDKRYKIEVFNDVFFVPLIAGDLS